MGHRQTVQSQIRPALRDDWSGSALLLCKTAHDLMGGRAVPRTAAMDTFRSDSVGERRCENGNTTAIFG